MRPGSGFALLFETMVMELAKQMPVKALAASVGEHDTRLWRILHPYVDESRRQTVATITSSCSWRWTIPEC